MTTTAATFSRRQRVLVGAAVGPHVEGGIIVKRHAGTDWYVVRFDNGSELSAHATSMRAV
jgi:hypothetical protein